MLRISFQSRNGGKALLTRKQILHIRSLIKFCANKLLTEGINDELKITVILDANLYKDEKHVGFAVWDDERHKAREFTLEVDTKSSFRNIVKTIAHEMVHVKQWAKGEFFEYANKDDIYFFNKKQYDAKKLDYWDQPWEIEAYGRQPGLVYRWVRENNLQSEIKDDY